MSTGHRQKGSGYCTVRIAPRTDQAGVKLLIGRALYQAIGEPARVSITAGDGLLRIVPNGPYAVASSANAQPRLSLGVKACEALGLDPEEDVTYAAQSAGDMIYVHTSRPADEAQLDGAGFKALRKQHKLTQKAWGTALGIHVNTVQDWEKSGTRFTNEQYKRFKRLIPPTHGAATLDG